MTIEQQTLFDLARSHARLASERLDESNVAFAISHLKESLRALELLQLATPKRPVQPVIEVTTKQP